MSLIYFLCVFIFILEFSKSLSSFALVSSLHPHSFISSTSMFTLSVIVCKSYFARFSYISVMASFFCPSRLLSLSNWLIWSRIWRLDLICFSRFYTGSTYPYYLSAFEMSSHFLNYFKSGFIQKCTLDADVVLQCGPGENPLALVIFRALALIHMLQSFQLSHIILFVLVILSIQSFILFSDLA